MICPICSSEDHRVLFTTYKDGMIRRRRKCDRCGHRFTTFEMTEERAKAITDNEELLANVRSLVAAGGAG